MLLVLTLLLCEFAFTGFCFCSCFSLHFFPQATRLQELQAVRQQPVEPPDAWPGVLVLWLVLLLLLLFLCFRSPFLGEGASD